MTRLHFNLRRILGDQQPPSAAAHRALKALNLADAESDEAVGPGWFESSWDLVRGLDVLEGPPADSGLAAERDEQPGTRLFPAPAYRAFGDAVQFGDLGFAVAAEVAHLDEFGEFGIDGLEFA
jgi:hypothetical protein